MSDADRVRTLAGEYEIARMTLNIPHPYNTDMAKDWIDTHDEEFKSGKGIVFAMVLQETDDLVGAMGLIISERFNRAEIGYWVGKPYWSNGYATEAAVELLRYGFMELELNKIHASHMVRNPASGRVMQKIGMQPEGLLKQHALKWDEFLDMAVYGILSETWHRKNKTKDVDPTL